MGRHSASISGWVTRFIAGFTRAWPSTRRYRLVWYNFTAHPGRSGAAETLEPRQGRKAAAVRGVHWVPPGSLLGCFLLMRPPQRSIAAGLGVLFLAGAGLVFYLNAGRRVQILVDGHQLTLATN